LISLYIDGVFVDSGNTGSTLIADMSNTGFLRIGTQSDTTNFEGSISDVRIYNKALAANEVKALYTQPTAYPSDSTKPTLEQGTTITAGGITLSSGGMINSVGKTELGSNSQSGIYFGYDTSQYGISIANSETGATNSYFNFLTTDGFDMKIGQGQTARIDGTLEMGPGGDIEMESIAGDRAVITFSRW